MNTAGSRTSDSFVRPRVVESGGDSSIPHTHKCLGVEVMVLAVPSGCPSALGVDVIVAASSAPARSAPQVSTPRAPAVAAAGECDPAHRRRQAESEGIWQSAIAPPTSAGPCRQTGMPAGRSVVEEARFPISRGCQKKRETSRLAQPPTRSRSVTCPACRASCTWSFPSNLPDAHHVAIVRVGRRSHRLVTRRQQ